MAEYGRKKIEFERMRKVFRIEVSTPAPISFGVCHAQAKVYTLLQWIDGQEVEKTIPKMNDDAQYRLGMESGKILKHI